MARELTQAGGLVGPGSQREPQILCWSCKELTPFQEDRCVHCGAPFAGSTGGTYAAAPKARIPPSRPPPRPAPRSGGAPLRSQASAPTRAATPDPKRSLHQLVDDMQRVHDVSRPRDWDLEDGATATLFQCPSCGRFVSESAASCICGVRFADAPATFACPECAARVPVLDDECPLCHVRFAPEPRTRLAYQCPRCGAEVDEDATRCGCGARFVD